MVLNPRKKFQESKDFVRSHLDLVVSNSFLTAMQAALVEQVMALPMTYDPNEAAAAYNRIIGARDFINHLLNIAEISKQPPTPVSVNLDHTAR